MRKRSTSYKGPLYVYYGVIVLWILGILGWLINLVQVLSHIPAHINEAAPLYILRIVGIFAAPLGSILGFFPS